MADDQPKKPARGFDVRTVIGLLLGVYGVVLLLMGLFATSEEELTKADGVNLNLWTGLGMLVTLLGQRGGPARGPVLALYSTATYLAAALATAALGPLYEDRGIAAVTLAVSSGLVLAAVPAARLRRGPGAALQAADAD